MKQKAGHSDQKAVSNSRQKGPANNLVSPAQARILQLQKSIGNRAVTQLLSSYVHSADESASRTQPPVQMMKFSRFQGFSWLFNWTYDEQEESLLALEKKCEEALDGIENYYNESFKQAPTDEFLSLKQEFVNIKNGTYDKKRYKEIKASLESILERADRESTKLAKYDIPLEEGFDLSQQQALPQNRYQITKDTTLEEMVLMAQQIAQKVDLRDLVVLREIMDILTQFISDAVIKFNSILLPSAIQLKAKIMDAATDVHTAYLLSTVKKDYKAATTCYIKSMAKISDHAFSSALFHLFAEQTQEKAYPKYREAKDNPYETGSIMLAAAFKEDGFLPDIVVGLPTGGVHAANRVVAALAIITGKKPQLWATRPQGVKKESKEFMAGTMDEDIFSRDEKYHLMRHIPSGGVNVAIVDDGFVSGDTMKMAKAIYAREFESFGRVDVRTGVIEAGFAQMGEEVVTSAGLVRNPADYVVSPGVGMAGRTGALDEVANARETPTFATPQGPKSRVGIVNSNKKLKSITVREILGS